MQSTEHLADERYMSTDQHPDGALPEIDGLRQGDTYLADYTPTIKPPELHSRGIIYTDVATLSDQQRYPVVTAQPKYPITDVPIGFTSAWFTSPLGHNKRTLEHFMRLGVPVSFIGPEGSYHPHKYFDLVAHSERIHAISMGNSAHNMHVIYDELPNVQRTDEHAPIDTSVMTLLGESRGAMVGMGVLALAKEHDRSIIYADLTAPCYPEQFIAHEHLESLATQVARGELRRLGSIAIKLAWQRLRHYPATLDIHPQAIAYNVLGIGPALFNGDTGQLARHIPPNQQMHITTFEDDAASMPGVWEDIFAGHDGVRLKQIDGAHLTIGNPETLEHIEGRMLALFQQLGQQSARDAQTIDFSKVHLNDGLAPAA